jgi:WD40 repeat protein
MKTLRGHRGDIQCVAFCPLNELLFSSGYDKTIKIWNASNGKLLRTLTGHTSIIKSLSFYMYAGNTICYLLSGSWDNTIRVWDIHSGQCLRILTGHENRVKVVISFALSDEDSYIISGSDDCTIKLWTLMIPAQQPTEELYSFLGHSQPIYCLALSTPPDGQRRYLASGSADHTIRIWDLYTFFSDSSKKTVKVVLNGHQGPVNSIMFSKVDDTKQLFSCSDDSIIMIWDYESGYVIRQLIGHRGGVTSLATLFRDDTEYLLTVSPDTTLRIWNSKITNELKRIDCSPSQCSLLSLALLEDISGTKVALGGTDGWLRLILRLEDLFVGLSMSGIGLQVNPQSTNSTSSSFSRVQFTPKTRVLKNLVVGGFDATNSSTFVQSSDSSNLLPKITSQNRVSGGKTLKHSPALSNDRIRRNGTDNKSSLTTLSVDEPPHSARSSISHTSSPGSVRGKRITPLSPQETNLHHKSVAQSNSSPPKPLQTKLLVDGLGDGPRLTFSSQHMSDDDDFPDPHLTKASASSPLLASSPLHLPPTEQQAAVESVGHDGRAYLRPVDCMSPSTSHRASRPLHYVTRRKPSTNKLPLHPRPKKEFILTVSLFAEPINPSKEAKVLKVLPYGNQSSSQS